MAFIIPYMNVCVCMYNMYQVFAGCVLCYICRTKHRENSVLSPGNLGASDRPSLRRRQFTRLMSKKYLAVMIVIVFFFFWERSNEILPFPLDPLEKILEIIFQHGMLNWISTYLNLLINVPERCHVYPQTSVSRCEIRYLSIFFILLVTLYILLYMAWHSESNTISLIESFFDSMDIFSCMS